MNQTIVQQTASHLQRELNRLENEKEKVRRALAAVQAIFGSGEGIRALRHPRRIRRPLAAPAAKKAFEATRKVLAKAIQRKHKGPEKVCPICHQKFRAYKSDQTFCGQRKGCKSNGAAAVAWRVAQRQKEAKKEAKKGTTLIPGDPLRPGNSAGTGLS